MLEQLATERVIFLDEVEADVEEVVELEGLVLLEREADVEAATREVLDEREALVSLPRRGERVER